MPTLNIGDRVVVKATDPSEGVNSFCSFIVASGPVLTLDPTYVFPSIVYSDGDQLRVQLEFGETITINGSSYTLQPEVGYNRYQSARVRLQAS